MESGALTGPILFLDARDTCDVINRV